MQFRDKLDEAFASEDVNEIDSTLRRINDSGLQDEVRVHTTLSLLYVCLMSFVLVQFVEEKKRYDRLSDTLEVRQRLAKALAAKDVNALQDLVLATVELNMQDEGEKAREFLDRHVQVFPILVPSHLLYLLALTPALDHTGFD